MLTHIGSEIDLAFLQPLYQRYQGIEGALERLENRFGLRKVSHQQSATMTGGQLIKLFEFLASNDDPHVASWLASQADLGYGSALAYYLRSHPDVGSVLDEIIRQQLRLFPDARLSTKIEGKHVVLELRQRVCSPGRRLVNEAKLIWIRRLISLCLGEDVSPTLAATMTPQTPRSSDLVALFRAPVNFGHGAFELHYPQDILTRQLPGYNPMLLQTLQRDISDILPEARKETHAATRVVRWLSEQSDLNQICQSNAASALNCGASTLRRHLAEEGTSFAELLQNQRRLRAFDFVALTDTAIQDIAFQLGYSDRSAFDRAFMQWFDIRPAVLRTQIAQLLPDHRARQAALNSPVPRALPRTGRRLTFSTHAAAADRKQYLSETDHFISELIRQSAASDETQSQMDDLVDGHHTSVLRREWMQVELAHAMLQARKQPPDLIETQILNLQSLGTLWLREVHPERMRIAEEHSQGHDLVYLLQFERDLIGIDRFEVAALLMSAWVFPTDLIRRMRSLAQAMITGQTDPLGQVLLETDAILRNSSNARPHEPWGHFVDSLHDVPLCISRRRRRLRHLGNSQAHMQPSVVS